MGKVIDAMNGSLDGFVAGSNGELDWAIVDEELHRYFNDRSQAVGAFRYGRRMYELMARDWPTADLDPAAPDYVIEFARVWKGKPKMVFSKSLQQVAWNSRLVRGNIAEEVAPLKKQSAQDLDLGGPTIAATFFRLGLIDECRLLIHPVVLGGGMPCFPSRDHPINLRLTETRTFGSGVVLLRYRHADAD
jgi:dihydrofolate reductase